VAGEAVEVVDVSLRDGLQSQAAIVSVSDKLAVLEKLLAAGVVRLELGSFVRADLVPQMANTAEVFRAVDERTRTECELIALVPNVRGAEAAVEAGATSIRIVLSASEGHSRSNTGRSVDEGISEAARVRSFAETAGIASGAALSTSFVCPFDGVVSSGTVVDIVQRLAAAGYSSISLADTLGRATPAQVTETVAAVRDATNGLDLNLHLHNTYGMGIANVVAGLEVGVRSFDASIAGIGGCPFAPGAAGNLSTEDLVFVLHELGYVTGITLERLQDAVQSICSAASCQPSSSVAQALRWTTDADRLQVGTT
jgi:hydroxymethylglutaryl-CoA lyase